MNIMSFESQAPAPLFSQTPEVIKKIAMGEMVGLAVGEFNKKRATLESLNIGLKKVPIDSVAGGVMALGQILRSSIAQPVYSKPVYDLTVERSH